MMSPLRTAVVGAGYFGRFHAKHLAANPDARLVAVVDPHPDRAGAVAAEHGAEALGDHHALIGKVDCVSIAAPTSTHFAIARDLIAAGINVLIEKPVTVTVAEGEALVAEAAARGVVFAAGHVERHSAAFAALEADVRNPRYVEAVRHGPFRSRATDVDVVLDLMIHDIDLVLALMPTRPVAVEAGGFSVVTDEADVAHARLLFEDGAVASLSASRVAPAINRHLRVFADDRVLFCDLAARRIDTAATTARAEAMAIASVATPEADSLGNEVADFLAAVREGRAPKVDGRAGVAALAIAETVRQGLSRAERAPMRARS